MRERLERQSVIDYQVERHNNEWIDHVARTFVTAGLVAWLKPETVLDPACGDASVLLFANRFYPFLGKLGDISQPNIDFITSQGLPPGWVARQGDVLQNVAAAGPVDVVVLTEILEHIEDPDSVVRAARQTSHHLVASSPEMRVGQVDTNEEHLWMFDHDGFLRMLMEAGWKAFNKTFIHLPAFQYDFAVWVCE